MCIELDQFVFLQSIHSRQSEADISKRCKTQTHLKNQDLLAELSKVSQPKSDSVANLFFFDCFSCFAVLFYDPWQLIHVKLDTLQTSVVFRNYNSIL